MWRVEGLAGMGIVTPDKRRAVTIALERWPEKSDRVIAQLCGVNHEMVKPLRPQVAESATSSGAPAKRQGADGKQYPAANKPAAKPAQQPDPESFGPDDAEVAASLAAEEADRRAMELLLASYHVIRKRKAMEGEA